MTNQDENTILWLISNKDFRDWVLEPNEYRNLYWEKWVEANRDKRDSVQKASQAIQKLKFEENKLTEKELAEILSNIIAREHKYPYNNIPRRSSSNLWLRIAASVIIFLAAGYLFYSLSLKGNLNSQSEEDLAVKMITMENPKSKRSLVTLPDGSSVYLNVQSRMTFPEHFPDSIRSVTLEGEAFFDIVKDETKPFIVHTKDLGVEVLGTSFNCRAFEDESEVKIALVTGKVRIRLDDKDAHEHLLTPGEKIIFDKLNHSFIKSSFNIEEETGWKDGILIFNNAEFPEFINKLEEWYGVEISLVNKSDKVWKVNGRFKNESLEEVLIGVRFTYDIDYEISGKNVILTIK